MEHLDRKHACLAGVEVGHWGCLEHMRLYLPKVDLRTDSVQFSLTREYITLPGRPPYIGPPFGDGCCGPYPKPGGGGGCDL